jgi:hypothetical protein
VTILPLSRPLTFPEGVRREVARRLAMPVLVAGLVLCSAGYLALAWLLLRPLL